MLTIDEKLSLLNSNHVSVPRLSIPGASLGTEALHGLGIAANPNSGSFMPMSTQFPQVFGLGESWDPEVTRIVGATTGYEARAYNARGVSATGRGIGIIMRGPNVDPIHDPRWGRTEESFGEDPYLVGELAKGYLAGLHGDDPNYLLGACTLKHFAANSNETTRLSSSSNLDARNMHEYYLATFRTAVVEGRADGIMTAYNQINGIPAGTSPILKSIVRDAWGFDGFFSTDGQAATHWVEDQHYYPTIEQAIGAAISTGSSGVLLQSNVAPTVNSAFAMGLITEADVDAAIGPALRIRFRTGDFDPPSYVPYKQIQATETPWATLAAAANALDVTRKTIVLLKNANATLPLDRTSFSQHRRDRPARRLRRARLVRRDARLPVRDRTPGDQQQARPRGDGHLRAQRQRRRRDVRRRRIGRGGGVRRQPPDLRRPALSRRGEPARRPTRGASRSTA